MPLHPQSQARHIRQTLCGSWVWGLGTLVASGSHFLFGKPSSRWREPSAAPSGQPSRSHWKWPNGDMDPTSGLPLGLAAWSGLPAEVWLKPGFLLRRRARARQRVLGDFSRWILCWRYLSGIFFFTSDLSIAKAKHILLRLKRHLSGFLAAQFQNTLVK